MLGEITAAGASLVALCVDDPARTEPMRTQYGLTFPILSDQARTVVRAWNLYNAKERGGIAIPAVYVLDAERRVRWCSIDRTAARVSPSATLAFLAGRDPTPVGRRRFRVAPTDMVRSLANALRRGGRTPHA